MQRDREEKNRQVFNQRLVSICVAWSKKKTPMNEILFAFESVFNKQIK